MKLTLSEESVKVFKPINLYIKLETEEEAMNFHCFLYFKSSFEGNPIKERLYKEWHGFLPEIKRNICPILD